MLLFPPTPISHVQFFLLWMLFYFICSPFCFMQVLKTIKYVDIVTKSCSLFFRPICFTRPLLSLCFEGLKHILEWPMFILLFLDIRKYFREGANEKRNWLFRGHVSLALTPPPTPLGDKERKKPSTFFFLFYKYFFSPVLRQGWQYRKNGFNKNVFQGILSIYKFFRFF